MIEQVLGPAIRERLGILESHPITQRQCAHLLRAIGQGLGSMGGGKQYEASSEGNIVRAREDHHPDSADMATPEKAAKLQVSYWPHFWLDPGVFCIYLTNLIRELLLSLGETATCPLYCCRRC